MNVRTETACEGAESGAAAMKWPLIGSAAGHVALLACLFLLMRAAAGPGVSGPVQVLLVEGDRVDGMTAEGTGISRKAQASTRASIPTRPSPALPAVSQPQPPMVSNPSAGAPLLLPARISTATSLPPSQKERVSGDGAENISGESVSGMFHAPAENGLGADGQGRETAAMFSRSGGANDAFDYPKGFTGSTGGIEGPEIRLLRERIESRIVYPEEAIRRGQEGEVLLRIRVGEGGIPRDIRIARSSGARLLDEAARNGVTRAAPLPSRPGWFEVPVRFFLR